MSRSRKQIISDDRYRLQNPYAHLDELDEMDRASSTRTLHMGDPVLNVARERLQNPHAYEDGEGGYSATMESVGRAFSDFQGKAQTQVTNIPVFRSNLGKRSGNYSDEEIEQVVRELQAHLWRNKEAIWPNREISNPLDVLDLQIALKTVGYGYREVDGIEDIPSQTGRLKVEGILDPVSKEVTISAQCPPSVRQFTTAHELGHAVLHNMQGTVHRDRATDGSKLSRDQVEKEADKFAGRFLMPEKQVRKQFAARFGSASFALNEATAFALGEDLEKIEKHCLDKNALCIMLSDARFYNGDHFVSLAEKFRVSKTAMAIRLQELGLVLDR